MRESSPPSIRRISVTLGVALLTTFAPVVGARASVRTDAVEVRVLQLINQGRAGAGKGAEVMHAGLRTQARSHSGYQSSIGQLTHDGAAARFSNAAPDPYETDGAPDNGFGSWCENVAYYYPGSTGATDEQIAQNLYNLWYNSPSHHDCMFDVNGRGFNAAGLGVYLDSNGYWWATFDSVRDSTPPTGVTSPPPTWTRVEQSASGVTYGGTWSTNSYASASGGTYRRSDTSGSYVRYTFTGTGVRWVGVRSPWAGIAQVRLDNVTVANVDQYGSANGWQQRLFERTGLASRSHVVEIRVTSARNAKSTGIRTYVDAFEKLS